MAQTELEILQYEDQLAQVRLASADLPEGPEKKKLDALETDLLELISLSKSTLGQLSGTLNDDDPLSEEYKLFKAELGELQSGSNEKSVNSDLRSNCKLKNDFESLQGMKCQAPFSHKWTNDVTYYNAIVSQVPDAEEVNEYDSIKVKVLFTNPTQKEMLPCPYYLEGKCRFSDDKCRYSHGESVSLDSLKEFREPDFSKLSKGCKILAKQNDELWYRGIVLSVKDTQCNVKFENNSKEEEILFHNILPLDSSDPSDGNISSEEDSDAGDINLEKNDEDLVKRILSHPPGSALGEWEKFTKGFGSRIMAKMGYVHGSGLGKDGMGRVEPVPAVILPAGKSLDHCMMLKEKAGNNKNLFKAERKLKQLQRKHEEKLKKIYNTEKEKTDVFTFLNNTLHPTSAPGPQKVKVKNEYRNETTRNLNVTGLQIAEELKKVEKEIKALNKSLARHPPQTQAFRFIKEKLASEEIKLSQLHASEKKIITEQNRRKDTRKLTEF